MSVIRVVNKFKEILSAKQRTRAIELAILMLVGGFLESFSVSLMIPFMNAIMDPNKVMSDGIARVICGFFGITSARAFMVFLAVLLAIAYILKNIYLLFEINIQYKFVYRNMYGMQRKLLEVLLNRPYEYFLNVDSGEVIRIITNDTVNTFALLMNLMNLFTEACVCGMLAIAIFIITPFMTLVISASLLVLVWVINFMIRPRLRKYGLEFQKANAGINKWLIQSIQGIKEIKVMSKEDFFQDNYDSYGKIYVDALRKKDVLGVTPKYLLEGISMGATFFAFALMIYGGAKLDRFIPVLSAIAMAAIRLLPSISRISNSLATVSYNESMLDKVAENLRNIHDGAGFMASPDNVHRNNGKLPAFQKEISFCNITYAYPGQEVPVLEYASMQVKKGESVGIIGSSGAGKTTAIDIILGLLVPQEGDVRMDGTDIRTDMPGWLSGIGYIPQMIFMLDGDILSNVAFGIREEDVSEEEAWRALEEASLAGFVKSLPDGIHTQIGERGIRLSGGQRQRIGIARALYRNPAILVFDEATSALDNATEAEIMEAVDSLHGQKTMLIIAHRLTTIEKCDRVYRVENRKIVQDR